MLLGLAKQNLEHERSDSKGKLSLNQPHAPSPLEKDSANLMSSMMKRLGSLEKTLQSYRQELKLKSTEIAQLKEKLAVYEETLHVQGEASLVEQVLKKNQKLKSELSHIKSFLESYGVR